MLEEDIKDVLEGLLDDIKSEIDQIVATALNFGIEYRKIAERVKKEGVLADVTAFGSSVIEFREQLPLKCDEEYRLDFDGEDDESINLNFEAQIQFAINKLQQMRFSLNLAFTGEIGTGYTSSFDLLNVDIGELDYSDLVFVDKIAGRLTAILENDEVMEFIEDFASSVVRVIIENVYPSGNKYV